MSSSTDCPTCNLPTSKVYCSPLADDEVLAILSKRGLGPYAGARHLKENDEAD